jgi:thioredoxin reductase (NADPH)
MSNEVLDVVIMGTGPAGLTAALYTARAQLKPLVLHGGTPGGQLTTTTEIENFPGFINGIDGNELIDNMTKQAERFGAKFQYGEVKEVDFSSKPYKLHLYDSTILCRSLIISTGARPRKMGLESESTYWSKGVTSCATCDGFFYKGQDVVVIGGGDSAMEEATFLTRMCKKVYLVHRKDKFRASKIMSDRVLKNEKIEIVWNSVIDEVLGDGKAVTGVRIKNVENGETKEIALKGVFLAIGHIPNTDPFKGKLDMDENDYLVTKPHSSATNIDGVFACGDCQDHVFRQAITAAGTGCMAAIEAERWLEAQGH